MISAVGGKTFDGILSMDIIKDDENTWAFHSVPEKGRNVLQILRSAAVKKRRLGWSSRFGKDYGPSSAVSHSFGEFGKPQVRQFTRLERIGRMHDPS